ncbi:Hypothetical protein MSYG_3856 [Malassezia sympodialis ATCC 42132]|uniref:Uncharacterized protein n=1 Tax=Malassezia sympodialis (strain ATCC 42132) TaxID=1230383 RepID=A0A1M8AAZ6_MALS4|nr:Hypothetical protein MSYG_3856 [Malassezia sympodialis ATCC 42132]
MTSPAAAAESSRRKWERLPTPPSSGHNDAVTIDTANQQRTTMVPVDSDGDKEALHQHKRVCRRDPHVLTPPSTRGRRMHDKLGLHRPSAETRSSHHRRHDSDSIDSLWMMGGMELGSTSSSWDQDVPSTEHAWPMHAMPIRDTPHNPFVEGGPADVGFTGPNASNALMRAMARPVKSPSKTVFVFRGQRVVCAHGAEGHEGRRPAGMAISPPRPQLLFPPRQREAHPEAAHALDYHALSDDECETTARRRTSANLFAQELAARPSSQPLPTVHEDADAAWLASEAPGRHMPVAWPRHPPAAKYELPAKNKELLERLECVDWSEEGVQSDPTI